MTEQTYWLYFEKGNHWTRRFCRKGFSHVSVLFSHNGKWVMLNPNLHKLETHIFNIKRLPTITDKDVRVLKVTIIVDKDKHVNMRLFYGLSCVPIIKYITGIRGWSVTPYGLYKELCSMAKYGQYSHGVQHVEII